MGIAAYNRGSNAISRQLDADQKPVEFLMMDDLNALPKSPTHDSHLALYNSVCDHHGWWAECPVTKYGYCYPSLRQAVQSWQVTITEYNRGIWVAIPL